jgi:ABC-type transport system substrate-binding protein
LPETATSRWPEDGPLATTLDELIYAGWREFDPAKREQIYRDLMQLLIDDPIAIYTVIPDDLYGVSADVVGWVPRVDQVVDLRAVSLE